MRGLRLPGEPDDERRPEDGLGLTGPDAVDQREEARAVAPSLHPRQEGAIRVLEREVEVGHDGRGVEHRRDEGIMDLARIEVEQPLTPQPVRP